LLVDNRVKFVVCTGEGYGSMGYNRNDVALNYYPDFESADRFAAGHYWARIYRIDGVLVKSVGDPPIEGVYSLNPAP
ncbi:hypothetical protein LCGC14_2092110, partial [marine sediment metagenome]